LNNTWRAIHFVYTNPKCMHTHQFWIILREICFILPNILGGKLQNYLQWWRRMWNLELPRHLGGTISLIFYFLFFRIVFLLNYMILVEVVWRDGWEVGLAFSSLWFKSPMKPWSRGTPFQVYLQTSQSLCWHVQMTFQASKGECSMRGPN